MICNKKFLRVRSNQRFKLTEIAVDDFAAREKVFREKLLRPRV